MYDFTGCECPVCHQLFRPDDDLVVCPDCGAPYHRTCYEKAGRCVYQAQHGADFEWQPPQRAAQQASTVVCAACGTDNPKENHYCRNCGAPLAGQAAKTPKDAPRPGGAGAAQPAEGAQFDYSKLYNNTYTPPADSPFSGDAYAQAIDPNETLSGIPAAEWAQYIGPSSRIYLLVFKQMELLQRKTSFSFSAMLFGPLYFFYRKAWKPGLIFAALTLLVQAPTFLYMMQLTESSLAAGWNSDVIYALCVAASVLDLVLMVVRGLYGFYLYQRTSAQQIRQIRQAYPDTQKRSYVLSAQGGTSWPAVIALAAAQMALLYVLMPLLGPNLDALLALLG